MSAAALQIRHYRKLKHLSLRDLAKTSGISASQLSKLETGKAKLTIEIALKLAGILQVPASIFLTEQAPVAMARRSITRAGSGDHHQTPGLDLEILCPDFKEKHNLFWRVKVTAATFEENGGWRQHPGQEFLLVLSGKLQLYTAYYDTIVLNEGDSILFDADQPHAYVAVEAEAEILMINSFTQQN
ncbi:helix-turn-helix domain-containing protein [Phyllobacterium endophyticum]|uniref:XRE family transcriptional regulator n=1 Tax=Phyllobacterium endophyticum TaxID=1149773 RepID=A0A2P7ARY6_9HYPH|nr:XRE family transcriptional regulator [Phyllobacterium endophyticum]MBB3236695.1 transcriptional regulator with XRE-family HTH domain [Phyllobacterium endophyticum]PSH56989.1 XRE family transcriptional regulator [Phyllobacterium endophyticum]TYR39676.1 helix-turn-helix domain-containing protein [Phyllobacterium endophyticum]